MATRWKWATEDKPEDFDFTSIVPTSVTLTSFAVTSVNLNRISGSTNLTVGSQTVSGFIGQAVIGGGTEGEHYKLTATASDASGNDWVIDADLFVRVGSDGSTLVVGTDTYGTLAEAQAYYDARGIASWFGLSPLQQDGYMRYGFAVLEQQRWKGEIAVSTQTAAWPRKNVEDNEGREISTTVTPEAIKHAQFEEALRYSSRLPNAAFNPRSDIPIKMVGGKVPTVEFAIDSRTVDAALSDQQAELGSYTLLLIRPYLQASGFGVNAYIGHPAI